MRTKIVAGNWKMNTNVDEGIDIIKQIISGKLPKDITVIVASPATHLYALQAINQNYIHNAAQNCHHELSGAYTGEISANTIKEIGIDYVIIGHSERRQYFAESNEIVKAKVNIALSQNLKVIFCCGEPLNIRETNDQIQYVTKQLNESLFHLDEEKISNIIIAYEPIWAIGTGKTATPLQAQEMHKTIRHLIQKKYGRKIANEMSILYGGSVKPNNAKEIFQQLDVDGGLIGGASLKAESFLSIVSSFDDQN